ncbi:MAG: hypothetical protein R3B60_02195 [Candidatus Paceibacterota bacterium]
MEDYIISKLIRKIIAPIVGVLILCSVIYGWWIKDYPAAIETVYMKPMQYVVGLVIQPRLNRLERAQDRIASTTSQQFLKN